MPLPEMFEGRLRLPAVAAPMFLVSGPDLVTEACKAGIIGGFPALNQRTSEGYADWLMQIRDTLAAHDAQNPERPAAPWGVNLIVHHTNPRLEADLKLTVEHRVPLVITSLGAVSDLVDAVHSYGGLVFHDVTTMRHAEKATQAGVDGLIPVCAGAGGHAGTLSPFALVSEIRSIFNGTIVLSGCISTGAHIAAALAMGADLAYMGTRFINTAESRADGAYKRMIADASAKDIIYTPEISGVPANFLRPSIAAAGLDPDNLATKTGIDFGQELDEAKAWKNIWSAGQGVGSISDCPPVAELVDRLHREYLDAARGLKVRAGV
ncbi:MAG: NAD(P)H-dependent flavin oxidoreductase [Alphaproteobacteria bacterium]